jgi:glycosyltransferase involved in cell wall biosynthesis
MVSVIIPARDAEASLDAQLRALSEQRTREWEVVLADNGSTDGTVEIARSWSGRIPGLRIIDASARRGAGAARNLGAEQARGDLLLFCDADDVVCPDWVEGFVAGQPSWDLAGGAVDYSALNAPGTAPAGTRLPGPGSLNWLPFVAGANLAVQRSAFEALGGFSERLVGGEDVEFCWRAQLHGMRFGVVPGATVLKRARHDPHAIFRAQAAWGRCSVELFTLFREHGMPRPSTAEAVKTYASLVRRLAALGDPAARREWARYAGLRWGRLVGSARMRTLCL